MRVVLSSMAQLFVAVSPAWAQQAAPTLSPEQLLTVVRANTWHVDFGGGSDLPGIWDFNADGSLNGRLRGAKAGTKCADMGKWKIHADMVCWDFTWLGADYNYKSVCARVRKTDERTYMLVDPSGKPPPVPFQPVKLSRTDSN